MEQNKFLNETSEQVVLTPNPRRIEINHAIPERAYGLFDSETGTQVSEYKKGTEGKVEFVDLNPNRHYDVGAIENPGDEKPQFSIAWTPYMKDDTETILKNSHNLPVIYPSAYTIKDNGSNSNNIFDLVDDKDDKVGQVMNLSQTGNKPQFKRIWSLKVKDDTQK